MARGKETSGEGWSVAGVGNYQVDGAPLQEMIWGAGAAEQCYDNKRLLMGGRSEEEKSRNVQKGLRQVEREGPE